MKCSPACIPNLAECEHLFRLHNEHVFKVPFTGKTKLKCKLKYNMQICFAQEQRVQHT